MTNIKKILSRLIPQQNKGLYSFCKWYVDGFNGDNNHNIKTNGELRLMQSVLPHCEIVFDVGANIGDWTELAFKIRPELKIHCFEPSMATFQRLRERSFVGNIVYNNFGISSTDGELPLYVYQDNSVLNSLNVRKGLEDGWGITASTEVERIRVETLDDYCLRVNVPFIDFLKINVEGHELEVLKGARDMLSQGKIKYIQFEYGGTNIDAGVLLKDLYEFFIPYNYVFYKIYPSNLRQVLRYDQRLENFQYQNWVIINKDL